MLGYWPRHMCGPTDEEVTDDRRECGRRVVLRCRSARLFLTLDRPLRARRRIQPSIPGGLPMTRDQRRGAPRDGPVSFRCGNCRLDVSYRAPGTAHRNHCPNCLWSRHLDDDHPGDRDADCGSSMEPIAMSVRGDGEWVLVHRCVGCDEIHLNRTAG